MDIRVAMVVIDCAEPGALAEFWSKATGYAVQSSDDEWAWIRSEDDAAVEIGFQRVPESKTVKNRVHIDLHSHDEEREAQRIEALGARRLYVSDDPEDVFITLADPEGNEFCVCREREGR
jgi:predicted enzyme related to lactoylglutathione lyase